MITEIEFIANLPELAKEAFIGAMSRSYLIDTLVQNDPNGIYEDRQCIQEFGEATPDEDLRKALLNQLSNY